MGREKRTGPIVAAIIDRGDKTIPPTTIFLNWRRRLDAGTANHRLLDLAIAVHQALTGQLPKWEADKVLEVAADVAFDQLQGDGLGCVLGSVELWTPAPHSELHLDPTVAIALEAHRAGRTHLRDLWLNVLAHWSALCHLGASPDGQVALAGTRFWKVGTRDPKTVAGLHHLEPGATLSQVWDAFYRFVADLPQRKNDGKVGTPPHVRAMPSFRGMNALAEAGQKVSFRGVALPGALGVCRYHTHRTGDRLQVWLGPGLETRGAIHSPAPAVLAQWTEPGRHQVAFAPRVIPDDWETG